MANLITDFKNGAGYIYVTDASGTNILKNIPNTRQGGLTAQGLAVTSAPLSGEIAARGKITFTGTPDDVTAITINGVSVLTGTIIGGALTLTQIASAVRDNINTTVSTPKYWATSRAGVVRIRADVGAGETPNSYVVACATAGALVATTEDMSGGTNQDSMVDSGTGYRFFLNADYDVDAVSGGGTAAEGDLTNAVEITNFLVFRGFNNALPYNTEAVNNTYFTASVERNGSIMALELDTDGGAANTLKSLTSQDGAMQQRFEENDIVIITGTDVARVITINSYSSGSNNIKLENDVNWVSADKDTSLTLQYHEGAAPNWYEINRTPSLNLTVANLRTQGIATGVQGVNLTSLPTNGTIEIEAGVDKEEQVYTGSPVLIGNIVIQPKAVPTIAYLDGDEIWVDYRATPTVGANSVTIFGITLTATQAAEGRVVVKSKYRLANTTWYSELFYKANSKDVADTVLVATKEASLGNPAANGYFLVSTAAGVRSWTPAITTISLYASVSPPAMPIAAGEAITTNSQLIDTWSVNSNEFQLTPFNATTGKFTFKEAGKYNLFFFFSLTSTNSLGAWASRYLWAGFVYNGTDIYAGDFISVPSATQTGLTMGVVRLGLLISDTDVSNGVWIHPRILNQSGIAYVPVVTDAMTLTIQKTL